MKLNWYFLGGWRGGGGGAKTKNLLWGEYGYFLVLHSDVSYMNDLHTRASRVKCLNMKVTCRIFCNFFFFFFFFWGGGGWGSMLA